MPKQTAKEKVGSAEWWASRTETVGWTIIVGYPSGALPNSVRTLTRESEDEIQNVLFDHPTLGVKSFACVDICGNVIIEGEVGSISAKTRRKIIGKIFAEHAKWSDETEAPQSDWDHVQPDEAECPNCKERKFIVKRPRMSGGTRHCCQTCRHEWDTPCL